MKRAAVLGLAASALFAATSSAQSMTGPRWQAWIGCWTATLPGGGQYGSSSFSGPVVCVTPTSDANVVEVSAISDGKVVSRDRLDASGRETPIDAKNCTGAQKAQFSSDERRVYLHAATTCEGMKSATSAILAMTPQGDWIDVRNVVAGGGDNVRVARYHDAGVPSSVPADIAAALGGRNLASQSARIAAGAPIGTNAVVEASRNADSAVVSAWVLERGQRFSLSANDIVALADAGLPTAVTDAMVAVSNPDAFAVARADNKAVSDDEYPGNRRRYVNMDPYYDPYGYGYGYGYSPYGYTGYGNYYGGGYYGGYYSNPIVIVTPGTTSSRGQMVKGHGYTQGQPSSTTDRSSGQRSPSSASSGSSSSSGGSSSSGSSGSSGSSQPAPQAETRTAHPKP
ncbi:MAG: hypothetical protein ABJE10_10625 [bacterium]